MSAETVQTGRQAVEAAIQRFFHMCNTHCPGNVAPLLTPDVEFLADQAANGIDATGAYFKWLWESYPDLTFRVENMVIDGLNVAAEVSYKNGPEKDGARCFVFRMKGDLIRRIRCY